MRFAQPKTKYIQSRKTAWQTRSDRFEYFSDDVKKFHSYAMTENHSTERDRILLTRWMTETIYNSIDVSRLSLSFTETRADAKRVAATTSQTLHLSVQATDAAMLKWSKKMTPKQQEIQNEHDAYDIRMQSDHRSCHSILARYNTIKWTKKKQKNKRRQEEKIEIWVFCCWKERMCCCYFGVPIAEMLNERLTAIRNTNLHWETTNQNHAISIAFEAQNDEEYCKPIFVSYRNGIIESGRAQTLAVHICIDKTIKWIGGEWVCSHFGANWKPIKRRNDKRQSRTEVFGQFSVFIINFCSNFSFFLCLLIWPIKEVSGLCFSNELWDVNYSIFDSI